MKNCSALKQALADKPQISPYSIFRLGGYFFVEAYITTTVRGFSLMRGGKLVIYHLTRRISLNLVL